MESGKFSKLTWHGLWRVGRSGPGNLRRSPGASCEDGELFPRSQGAHPREVYGVSEARYLSSY